MVKLKIDVCIQIFGYKLEYQNPSISQELTYDITALTNNTNDQEPHVLSTPL